MFRVLPTINFSCQMAFAQNIETLFTLYAHKLQPLARGVTRALIGGGVYSYIRVLPDGFLLK